MTYIEALDLPPDGMPCLFLAGAITGAPDWQAEIVGKLSSLPMAILNPRRKNFPIHDPTAARAQITWEHKMLRRADMISFWFSKETLGPIVLYELGAHSMTGKPLVVGMDREYQRAADVVIQTGLVRPEVKIVYSIDELAAKIKAMADSLLGGMLWK